MKLKLHRPGRKDLGEAAYAVLWALVFVPLIVATFPGLTGLGHRPRWPWDLAAVFFAVIAVVVSRWKYREDRRLRRELLAQVRSHAEGTWVFRDPGQEWGVGLGVQHLRGWLFAGWAVQRIPEEVARELNDAEAEGQEDLAVMYERFIMVRGMSGVVREDEAALINTRSGKGRDLPGTTTRMRWRRHSRLSKAGLGAKAARTDEIAELIRQLRGAEQHAFRGRDEDDGG